MLEIFSKNTKTYVPISSGLNTKTLKQAVFVFLCFREKRKESLTEKLQETR